MAHQFSETRIYLQTYLSLVLVAMVLGLCAPNPALAQSSGEETAADLDRAVDAVRQGDYEPGLRLLDSVGRATDDLRVAYYRGYALEKLGRCDAARSAYRRAAGPRATERLRGYALDALSGFDKRCVPAAPQVEQPDRQSPVPRSAAGSGRVGWQVFGWTTTIVGGLILAAVPVKSSIEGAAFGTATPYFEQRYGCQVDGTSMEGADCNESALQKDPAYERYSEGLDTAERSTNIMLVGGVGLATVGLGTLLTLAVTEPSVTVAVSPAGDGAAMSAAIHF